jgi:hypothetical protein
LTDGGELHDETLAPAVLGLRAGAHVAPDVGLGARVHDPSVGRESTVADPDGDSGIRAEIADPRGVLAVLGDHIEALVAAVARARGEPDLDLTGEARATAGGREIEELRLGIGRRQLRPRVSSSNICR